MLKTKKQWKKNIPLKIEVGKNHGLFMTSIVDFTNLLFSEVRLLLVKG